MAAKITDFDHPLICLKVDTVDLMQRGLAPNNIETFADPVSDGLFLSTLARHKDRMVWLQHGHFEGSREQLMERLPLLDKAWNTAPAPRRARVFEEYDGHRDTIDMLFEASP